MHQMYMISKFTKFKKLTPFAPELKDNIKALRSMFCMTFSRVLLGLEVEEFSEEVKRAWHLLIEPLS